MGITDKVKNEAEKLIGRGKEALGDVKDDPELQAEGRADQTEAEAKNAGEHVKDAASDATESVKQVFKD